MRNLFGEVLLKEGYQVLRAQDAEMAVVLAARCQGPIDLLLTDVVMPRMSGKQLAEELIPLRPRMKVIFMSGYTDHILESESGASQIFLQKPCTITALVEKVRQVLKG